MLEKQLVRSKSGLRIVPKDENDNSPFCLKEPRWIPDKEVSNCSMCCIKFGITIRKHHCRRCGRIFCKSCCDSRQALPRMSFVDPVRICLACLPQTLKETDFFNNHLKTLMQGANFNIVDSLDSVADREKSLHCRLSADHRYLIFCGAELGPLLIENVSALKTFNNLSNGVSSVEIGFKEGLSPTPLYSLTLSTLSDDRHKQRALHWISAFQSGYSLLTSSF